MADKQRWAQGCSQPHSPGWARVHCTTFLFFSSKFDEFSYFSSNFTYFLPHFGPPGGRLAHPGRPWLRHWMGYASSTYHHTCRTLNFVEKKVHRFPQNVYRCCFNCRFRENVPVIHNSVCEAVHVLPYIQVGMLLLNLHASL